MKAERVLPLYEPVAQRKQGGAMKIG